MIENMKTCKTCGIEKELGEFYKAGKYKSSYCKECETEKGARWRNKNPEKCKEYERTYLKKNPDKYRKKSETLYGWLGDQEYGRK